MSKQKKRIDSVQLSIFDYDEKIEEYVSIKNEILCSPSPAAQESNNWEEDCIEIVAAIKRAIKQSGKSREQIVEAINAHYGWQKDQDRKNGKHLSIHMFNHYLSKPAEYPIPSYYLIAIQNITKSLDPCRVLAEAEDAQVISGDEVRHMRIGKLDDALSEIQRLKKELKGKR